MAQWRTIMSVVHRHKWQLCSLQVFKSAMMFTNVHWHKWQLCSLPIFKGAMIYTRDQKVVNGLSVLCPLYTTCVITSNAILWVLSFPCYDWEFWENRQCYRWTGWVSEIYHLKFKDCREVTNYFRGTYWIYPNSIKKNRRMSTCKHQDLNCLTYAQKFPRSLPIYNMSARTHTSALTQHQ